MHPGPRELGNHPPRRRGRRWGARGTGARWRSRRSGGTRRSSSDFGAVNYYCQAWVNGQLVGDHEGGYTPFAIRVDPFCGPGKPTRSW